MPQDPPGDALERLRGKALDGDLPTQDVARLEGEARTPSDATLIRPLDADAAPSVPPAGGAPPQDLPAGRPFGRYVLLEELGHGGMGVVWKAFDTQLRRVVALKGMIAEEFAEQTQIERFMREARAAARLSHPNIVPVYDVGEFEGQHYFTAEYIEGLPLDLVMKTQVPARQGLLWVKQVAEALAYAHQQGVVHRDVKPGNILVDKDGQPHVMDFGLAKHAEAEATGRAGPALTVSGDLLGTPRYMSPEQTRGAVNAGPASDQFSLGVVMYELLTGRAPFDGVDMRTLLNAIAEHEPPRPTSVSPRIHRDVETICLKSLEKDPARRYASMADLAADIGRYLDGEPIEARPATAFGRLWRKAARHEAILLTVLAAVAVALGSGVWAVVSHFAHVREVSEALDRVTRANERAELALVQERAAKQALEKSYAVSTVFSRFEDLADTLRGMEGACYDSSLSPAKWRGTSAQAWNEVERFMEETDKDSASQATMWALAGWARLLAGYPDEAQAWMEKATRVDPDVPYGALLRAFLVFDEYVERQPLPETWVSDEAGPRSEGSFRDLADMRQKCAALPSLLAQADHAAVWGSRETRQCRAALAALDAMQRGAFVEAAKGLSEALAGPTLRWMESTLRFARGRALYLANDLDGAKRDLSAVVQARPRQAEAWNDLGLVADAAAHAAVRRGTDPRPRYAEAIEDFARAAAVEPARALFHRNLGSARADAGDLQNGLTELTEALRLDPASAEAWVDRATVRCDLGDLAGGIADFDEALRLNPDSTVAWFDRGRTRELMGDHDAAIRDLSEAIRRDPALAQAWIERGGAKNKKGDVDGARADLDEAVRLAPDMAGAWFGRGVMRAAKGDREGAARDYSEAIRLDPRMARAWYNRAVLRLDAGELDGAIADLDEAVRGDAAKVEAYVARGVAWERKGDPARALADFEKALALAPADFPNRKPVEAEVEKLRKK